MYTGGMPQGKARAEQPETKKRGGRSRRADISGQN